MYLGLSHWAYLCPLKLSFELALNKSQSPPYCLQGKQNSNCVVITTMLLQFSSLPQHINTNDTKNTKNTHKAWPNFKACTQMRKHKLKLWQWSMFGRVFEFDPMLFPSFHSHQVHPLFCQSNFTSNVGHKTGTLLLYDYYMIWVILSSSFCKQHSMRIWVSFILSGDLWIFDLHDFRIVHISGKIPKEITTICLRYSKDP